MFKGIADTGGKIKIAVRLGAPILFGRSPEHLGGCQGTDNRKNQESTDKAPVTR